MKRGSERRRYPARPLVLMSIIAVASMGCTHAQRPDTRPYVVSRNADGVGAALAIDGAGHDCQKEHEECMETCWDRRYPWPHSEEQSGWYYDKCVKECRERFVECDEEQEQALREREKKLSFSSMDRALEWLREHKGEVTLGTIVVIGGVAFALAISPVGWLVLVPVVAGAA